MKHALIGCLTLVLVATSAFAQIGNEEHERMPPAFKDRHRGDGNDRDDIEMPRKDPANLIERLMDNPELAEKAGLSKEQISSIKTILYDINMQMIDLRAEMEKAGMEQARLMTSDEPDEAAIMKAIEKTGEIRTKMAKLRIQSMLKIKKIIKPEQFAKMKEFISERRKEGMRGDERVPFREKMKERFRRGEGGEGMNEFRRERGSPLPQVVPPPPTEPPIEE